MKTCPACAEQIQDAALKCKHCGHMLGALPVAERPRGTERRRTRFTLPNLLMGAVLFVGFIYAVNWIRDAADDTPGAATSPRKPIDHNLAVMMANTEVAAIAQRECQNAGRVPTILDDELTKKVREHDVEICHRQVREREFDRALAKIEADETR